MHHFTDGGLQNVWLVNGYTVHRTPYGSAVSIHDMDGLARAICMALTQKQGVLSGKEVRYIRQAGMYLFTPPARMRRRTQPGQRRQQLLSRWALAAVPQPVPDSEVPSCRSRR
jgi:hypothetical protein